MKTNLLDKFILLGFIALFNVHFAAAQIGCTDPLALNFDAMALENDGSCTYPETTYLPDLIAEMPAQITEASGAEFFNGQFWVHQDGGVEPMLHTIDTLTGALLQTLPLPSLQNLDWEELAEDADYLYIGDFGNNGGNRTDLRIYKISKNDLLVGTATAETIDFQFSDQTDFTFNYHAHNFDCEAFIALGDSLHIFSKRWVDFATHHYTLPKTPGTHTAQLRDSFDVGFLTSSADVSEDGVVLLMGYDTTSLTSIWMLWDYPGTDFFKGNKRQIILGNAFNMSQAEGIAFSSNSTGFICTERLSILPARMLRFDIGQWLYGVSGASEKKEAPAIAISPNPFSNSLTIEVHGIVDQNSTITLLGIDGRPLRTAPISSGLNQIDTDGLPHGTYLVLFKKGENYRVEKLVKQ